MALAYKANPASHLEIKEADDGWEVAGYASTFGGEPDLGGDIIERGAFSESLKSRRTKLLYNHEDPIGSEIELREDTKGLIGRWSIVGTTIGADAHKLAKSGVLDSLSIGYRVNDAAFEETDGRMIRRIKAADVYEVSLVALPMNERAVVTRVKRHDDGTQDGEEDGRPLEDLPFGEKLARIAQHLQYGADEAEALWSRRADDGRKLNEAHIGTVERLLAEAKAVAERLDALLRDAAAEANAPTSEAARRLELFLRAQARKDRHERLAALGISMETTP